MWQKNLTSKLGIGILIILLVLFGRIKFEQWRQQRAIDMEKDSLIKQAQQLQEKNQELSDSLSFLNTESYKEKVARQQLNMKRDGEIVYNFSEATNVSPAANLDSQNSSNPLKWWHYFFP